MNAWGVLGGSFDPPHLGHVWIATLAWEQLGLDRVMLVPAAVPPHKAAGTVAPYRFRLDLLRRLEARRPWLVASDLEADPCNRSYTVDTLRRLRSQSGPGVDLWLLLGSDSLLDLPQWREPQEVLAIAGLGVYGRPGYVVDAPPGARVRWIDGPACGLSSTLIRQRLRRGEGIDTMVPVEILDAIGSAGFYRGGEGDG